MPVPIREMTGMESLLLGDMKRSGWPRWGEHRGLFQTCIRQSVECRHSSFLIRRNQLTFVCLIMEFLRSRFLRPFGSSVILGEMNNLKGQPPHVCSLSTSHVVYSSVFYLTKSCWSHCLYYQISFAPHTEWTSSFSILYISGLIVNCLWLSHGGLPKGEGHASLTFVFFVPDISTAMELALDLSWTAKRMG